MNLSPAIEHYLKDQHVPYDVLEHPHSSSALETAHAAHVTPAQVAKAVVLRDGDDLLMCVLPASHELLLNWVDRDFGGHHQLVSEDELAQLFPDCEIGAVPPLGQAYGMKVVWDNSLRHARELYLEAGDHCHLLRLTQDDFIGVMASQDHATISCSSDAAEYYRYCH